MAWQSPSSMSNGGAAGGAEHNGPAGTEYTLQGKLAGEMVVPFLISRCGEIVPVSLLLCVGRCFSGGLVLIRAAM